MLWIEQSLSGKLHSYMSNFWSKLILNPEDYNVLFKLQKIHLAKGDKESSTAVFRFLQSAFGSA